MNTRLEAFTEKLREQVGRGIGASEAGRLWDRHVQDALAAGPHLPSGARVADIGSGIGLPGVPLALVRPDLAVTLVEPRGERVRWLRQVLDQLEVLTCDIYHGRWATAPVRRYDVAVARALAPPAEAVRLIRAGPPVGRILLYAAASDGVPEGLSESEILPSVLDKKRVLLSIVGVWGVRERRLGVSDARPRHHPRGRN